MRTEAEAELAAVDALRDFLHEGLASSQGISGLSTSAPLAWFVGNWTSGAAGAGGVRELD